MVSTTQARWPFLTLIKYLNKDYLGIVQNSDANFVHMYVIESNMTADQKKEFVSCGELYWWGSNRQIPINVFLGGRFRQFSGYLKSFSQKEVVVVYGPMPSLDSLINKRTKKRTVQLVKNTNNLAMPPAGEGQSGM
jgi:hypothetical protein